MRKERGPGSACCGSLGDAPSAALAALSVAAPSAVESAARGGFGSARSAACHSREAARGEVAASPAGPAAAAAAPALAEADEEASGEAGARDRDRDTEADARSMAGPATTMRRVEDSRTVQEKAARPGKGAVECVGFRRGPRLLDVERERWWFAWSAMAQAQTAGLQREAPARAGGLRGLRGRCGDFCWVLLSCVLL